MRAIGVVVAVAGLMVAAACGGEGRSLEVETPTTGPTATETTGVPGPTAPPSETPVEPTSTPSPTAVDETPTATPTEVPPTATATNTVAPPTATSTPAPTNTPPPPTPTPAPEHHEVKAAGDRWTVTSLVMPRGSTVRFSWPRGLPHNVSIPAMGYRSGDVSFTGDFTVTFGQPGTYTFICEAHESTMVGTVVVE